MTRPTRYYSKKQEIRTAKVLNSKVVANSGATLFDKGDVSNEHMLIECKTLAKPQETRTIHKDWFKTIEEEALCSGKHFSAVVFDFGDGKDYVAVPIEQFKELFECWRKEIDDR